MQLVARAPLGRLRLPRCRRPGSRRCWAPPGGRSRSAGRARRCVTVCSGTTGRDGSPSSPGCTHGKCPKSVKFSSWRDASQFHAYGPGAHHDPRGIVELGDLEQRVARLLQRHPQQPEPLLAAKRVHARLAGDLRRVGELRDQPADAVAAVLPAVVGAHDPVPDHAPERERGAAVDAEVAQRVRGAGGVAPQHEVLAEQPHCAAARRRAPPSTPPGASNSAARRSRGPRQAAARARSSRHASGATSTP